MRWSYKIVYYELKKEGLLGDAFLDETEMEESLNEYGRAGWELVSLIDVKDGVVGAFKQAIGGEDHLIAEEPETESSFFVENDSTGRDGDMASDLSSRQPERLHEEFEYREEPEDSEAPSEKEIGSIKIE